MKRLLITYLVSIIIVQVIHMAFFDNLFTPESISNALFIVGLFMFFISLIIVTDAGRILMIVSYSFKSVIKRNEFKYRNYYEYMKDREREEMLPYTIQLLIVGTTYLIVAFILAQIVIGNY